LSEAATSSSGGSIADPDGTVQYLEVVVPQGVTPGWAQLTVETVAGRSAPVTVRTTDIAETVITGISPPRPHPAQMVLLATLRPSQIDSTVELIDASGKLWRPQTGVSSRDISVLLPDEVAEGEATVRVRRTENHVESFSAPFTFFVTAGPLPLKPSAVALMTSVAPGQWTDLVDDYEIGFEIERADQVDIKFTQGDVVVINQTTGRSRMHVQVPITVTEGPVSVRTRTWIEQTASEWSVPATFRVRARPVAPSVSWIDAGPSRRLVWWTGTNSPALVRVQRGEALTLMGFFPVARVTDLRIQLTGLHETYDLAPNLEVIGGVQIEIPAQTSAGDWRLVIDTAEGLTSPQEVTTLRVN
jgi:hypothetical protein